MIYPHNETSFWRQEVNVTCPELTDGVRTEPVVWRVVEEFGAVG